MSSWVAFLDAASGAGSDSMVLAVAAQEILTDRPVLACVREFVPPFSPESVCAECATILKSYGLSRVMSDRYSLNWVSERFRTHGMTLEYSTRSKSDLYRELILLVTSKTVELLDNKKLRNQLMSLERRLSRGGQEQIDAIGHEDCANAAAGAIVLASEGSGGPLVGAMALVTCVPALQCIPMPNGDASQNTSAVERTNKQAKPPFCDSRRWHAITSLSLPASHQGRFCHTMLTYIPHFKGNSATMTKRETAQQALANIKSLHSDFHRPILDQLEAAGLLDRPAANGNKVNAAASNNRIAQVVAAAEVDPIRRAALRTALAELRNAGTSLDDIVASGAGSISIAALNSAMKGQPVHRRMNAKAALAAVGLID